MLKTTRNILIANLALSNIFLCLFTMPLTMLDLIHNYWPLGYGQVSNRLYKSISHVFSIFPGNPLPTEQLHPISFCILLLHLSGADSCRQIALYCLPSRHTDLHRTGFSPVCCGLCVLCSFLISSVFLHKTRSFISGCLLLL